MRRPPATTLVLAALAGALLLAGCGRSGGPGAGTHGRGFQVVAAENFWGSIAAQLAGDRASVTSIIVNPDTDPHSYEPTAQDARTLAGAQMAIVNGIGYDNWAPKLLQASPLSGRVVLNVGDLLGLKEGDNPHQWYSPSGVRRVVRIVADYDQARSARRRLLRTAQAGLRSATSRAMTRCAGRSARATRASRSATARASSSRSAKTSA